MTGLFALLPLLNVLPGWIDVRPITPPAPVAEQQPAVIQPEKPPIVPVKPLEKPKLEEPPPPLELHQLERALQVGDGGIGVDGGFVAFAPESAEDIIKIFDIGDVDKKPRALVAVTPLYPYSMRESGEVVVEFVIDENGKVIAPRIHRSTHHAFEQPAIDAVRRSEWQPATIDGKPVRTGCGYRYSSRGRRERSCSAPAQADVRGRRPALPLPRAPNPVLLSAIHPYASALSPLQAVAPRSSYPFSDGTQSIQPHLAHEPNHSQC